MTNINPFLLIKFILPMVGHVEAVFYENLDEQEFMVLSTRYRMTEDPTERPRRTTKAFIKPPTPYAFMDYFNSSHRAEKWPNDTIYYNFEDDFSPNYKSLLQKCFGILENRTCIKFEPYQNVEHRNRGIIQSLKIYSVQERRCITSIGYNPYGNNRIHLNPKFCKTELSILHLLMHVLGFDHEYVRKDRIYFLRVGFWPDDWIQKEYNISTHHNTYQYMPYNWDSIMHMAALYLIEEMVMDDKDISKRVKRSEPYYDQRVRPRFENWFPNNLHEFDLNNINRHYKCGEYNFLCRDYASSDVCHYSGLGQRGTLWFNKKSSTSIAERQIFNVRKYAQCVNKQFAERRCPKTCGHCYIFYKNDLKLSSEKF